MEMGCPPLFEFASQSDASMLEHAANDAVEKVQLSRCQHFIVDLAVCPVSHVDAIYL